MRYTGDARLNGALGVIDDVGVLVWLWCHVLLPGGTLDGFYGEPFVILIVLLVIVSALTVIVTAC